MNGENFLTIDELEKSNTMLLKAIIVTAAIGLGLTVVAMWMGMQNVFFFFGLLFFGFFFFALAIYVSPFFCKLLEANK